jgi:hypothetical protein
MSIDTFDLPYLDEKALEIDFSNSHQRGIINIIFVVVKLFVLKPIDYKHLCLIAVIYGIKIQNPTKKLINMYVE